MDIIKEAVLRINRGGGQKPAELGAPANESNNDLVRDTFPDVATSLTSEELAALRIYHTAMRNRTVHKAFTNLRTHVIQRTGKRSCSIVVTAVSPGGGASFVALNLAAAFATDSSGLAILADCNFAGHRYEQFGDSGTTSGISDYIDGTENSLDGCMTDIGIPRLRLLTGGTQRDPQREYFTRARAKEMFVELASRYENCAVVVDAPPALVSANVNVLASYCDAILLVVPYAGATTPELQATVRSLPKGMLVGSVFNNVPHWRTES